MRVEYIAQPDTQLGLVLSGLFESDPKPSRLVFVSAFVGLQAIIRIKEDIFALRAGGTDVRFVLGIDLGGTSQEVLTELLDWPVEVYVVKHRAPGHTFHPKLYLFEWCDHATIILGSNNLTDGGFFRNYESAAQITYLIPDDREEFGKACASLKRFLDPMGSAVYALTGDFLGKLVANYEIPTEAEARHGRDFPRTTGKRESPDVVHLFGVEDIKPPPPLPAVLLESLLREVRRSRRDRRKNGRTATNDTFLSHIDEGTSDPLLPAAFYMTLPKLQGSKIPGEARIPLEAIGLAKEFWGWQDEYSREESPRAGRGRIYWNWRPRWRIFSVSSPHEVTVQTVRMYMYENSSDFRFYVRPLVNAGADTGDVIRIRRISAPDAEYECVLARQGTAEHVVWVSCCTQAVRSSTRRFGYA